VQPHWLLELHSQVAPEPHWVAEPVAEHVVVQKCVVASPNDEHSGAFAVCEQSLKELQYAPMPISLPVSPGCPQVEVDASTAPCAASGGVVSLGFVLDEHPANTKNANSFRRPMRTQ
jgi:hypothetical protein